MTRRVVILGGGLAGLSAAWVLRKKGYQATVLEKSDHCGGLAVTRTRGGFRYDLGPHNIHTRHEHFLELLRTRVGGLFRHHPTFTVYRRKRFIPYPITGSSVITSLPAWVMPAAAASFVLARLRMFFKRPGEDRSFRDWIVNRFGGVVYNEYFRRYPRKIWGLPPEEIDRYVAEKRIPVVGLLDLVKGLFRATPEIKHSEFALPHMYLTDGIGQLADLFEREVLTSGGEIQTGVRLLRIIRTGSSLTEVEFENTAGEARHLQCDYLLSTIPVDDFLGLQDEVPEAVRTSVERLAYRSGVLLFLAVGRRNVIPSYSLYFTESDPPFSRVTDMGRYSEKLMPEGKTLLCFEFPCKRDDEIWSLSVDEMTHIAIAALEETGLLRGDEVEDSFREELSHFYPLFALDFQEDLRRVFRHLGEIENTLSYGRQGGFEYANSDEVTHMGLVAANAVMTQDRVGGRCKDWFSLGVRSAYEL